jgi:hypothetical protein
VLMQNNSGSIFMTRCVHAVILEIFIAYLQEGVKMADISMGKSEKKATFREIFLFNQNGVDSTSPATNEPWRVLQGFCSRCFRFLKVSLRFSCRGT